MCRNRLFIFVLIFMFPAVISLTGCSDDDDKGENNSANPMVDACPVVTQLNFQAPTTPSHDCDQIISDNNYLCIENVKIGNRTGNFSIANPNMRASSSILFAFDWGQFKEQQQTFKDGDVSCLNPIEPGEAFEDAAAELCLTAEGLFDEISNVIALITAGTISPTITTGVCQ